VRLGESNAAKDHLIGDAAVQRPEAGQTEPPLHTEIARATIAVRPSNVMTIPTAANSFSCHLKPSAASVSNTPLDSNQTFKFSADSFPCFDASSYSTV
jgi:hypothetical protein